MNPNIDFLTGKAPDPYGRTLADYLAFTDTDWESQHDVIQMAFPTKTQSKFHPDQPFLPAGWTVWNRMLTTDELQRARAAISTLLHSYLNSLGVEFLKNGYRCTFSLREGVDPYWANSSDHNTLRLTRILECLGIFEMYGTQADFHDFLVYTVAPKYSDRINAATVAFWVAARENKLHLLR